MQNHARFAKRGIALALAATLTATMVPSFASDAASKTKVYMVTQAKNENGDNIKYTYNKKGLVTKIVSTKSYKTSDSDITNKETTTFKYNKKGKISTKTEIDATTTKEYKMDRTTGKTIKSTIGTVTNTSKNVTNYTYDKKGRATKVVTTATFSKSGKTTEVAKNGNISFKTNPNNFYGTYYYDNDMVTTDTVTTETTYTPSGDGYVVKTVEKTSGQDDISKPTGAQITINNSTADVYHRELDTTYVSEETESTDSKVVDKTVTTKTYKYDKKGRATSCDISIVFTDDTETNGTYDSTYAHTTDDTYYDSVNDVDKPSKSTFNSIDHSTYKESKVSTNTFGSTEKYTYNKKNQMTKAVFTDKNNDSYKETSKYSREGSEKWGFIETDAATGAVVSDTFTSNPTQPSKRESETVITKENGVRTVTGSETSYNATYNSQTNSYELSAPVVTQKTPYSRAVKPTTSNSTSKFTYDKNGNLSKVVANGKSTYEADVFDDDAGVYKYTDTYDENNNRVRETTTVSDTSKTVRTRETEVKEGTKRIAKVYSKNNINSDRENDPAVYLTGYVTYTIKPKTFASKAAKTVEAQQWILQNNAYDTATPLNGVVGLVR